MLQVIVIDVSRQIFVNIAYRVKTYPLPTPATYPKGAGTPKKCFLFRVFSETEGTAISADRLFVYRWRT